MCRERSWVPARAIRIAAKGGEYVIKKGERVIS
jgi:hypothetical protein